MKYLMTLAVLLFAPMVYAQGCEPEFEFAVELSRVTPISPIYAHVESLRNPEGCPNVPLNLPAFSLTLKDNNGVETDFPLTVLSPLRVRFTPTTLGLYTLTATATTSRGTTTHTILFRKGPF